MTDEEFGDLLDEILHRYRGDQLLHIPGVYEAVSEFFNNEVVELWEERNAH